MHAGELAPDGGLGASLGFGLSRCLHLLHPGNLTAYTPSAFYHCTAAPDEEKCCCNVRSVSIACTGSDNYKYAGFGLGMRQRLQLANAVLPG